MRRRSGRWASRTMAVSDCRCPSRVVGGVGSGAAATGSARVTTGRAGASGVVVPFGLRSGRVQRDFVLSSVDFIRSEKSEMRVSDFLSRGPGNGLPVLGRLPARSPRMVVPARDGVCEARRALDEASLLAEVELDVDAVPESVDSVESAQPIPGGANAIPPASAAAANPYRNLLPLRRLRDRFTANDSPSTRHTAM